MVHQRKRREKEDDGRLVGQAVKTPASHAGNTGSIPVRVTKEKDEEKVLIKRNKCGKIKIVRKRSWC